MAEEYWSRAELQRASAATKAAVLLLATLAKCCHELEAALAANDPAAPEAINDLHAHLQAAVARVRAYGTTYYRSIT